METTIEPLLIEHFPNLSSNQIEGIKGIIAGTHRAIAIKSNKNNKHYVYLSQQGMDCAYKIGYAENPDTRNKDRTNNSAGRDFRVVHRWKFTCKKEAHRFEQELLGDKIISKYRGGTNKKPTEWLLPKNNREELTLDLILSRINFCIDNYLVVDEKQDNWNIYRYKEE